MPHSQRCRKNDFIGSTLYRTAGKRNIIASLKGMELTGLYFHLWFNQIFIISGKRSFIILPYFPKVKFFERRSKTRVATLTLCAENVRGPCEQILMGPQFQFNSTTSTLLLGLLLLTPQCSMCVATCVVRVVGVTPRTGVKTRDLLESPQD